MSYQPTGYNGSSVPGYSPEEYYGCLLDENGRPTEVFSRMTDSFFFWIDANCEVPGLQSTGTIESAKYAWMSSRMGASPQACHLLPRFLPSLYEMVSVPCSCSDSMPVLDRRGWLRLAVFEARAAPEEAHRHWNKVLALFALTDPSTRTPFPTPLPRSALPAFADPSWRAVYVRWRMQAIAAASRARVTSALRPHSMRAAGAGFGASATGLRYAGFRHARHASGSESGGGDHATVLDTVNTFGTLANTLIGATTGGGGGNSAFGSAGGLFGAGLSGSGFGGTGF